MAGARKIDVRFEGSTLRQIEEIGRLSGKPIPAILRESVNLTNWLYKERSQGARLLLAGPGAETPLREVVFKS
jgi:hypothetical protein